MDAGIEHGPEKVLSAVEKFQNEIDLQVFEQVYAVSKYSGNFMMLVNIFWQNSQERIGKMFIALEEGQFEELKQLAHTMKGSCAIFGAKSLADGWQTLEDQCEALPREKVDLQIRALAAKTATLRGFLESKA